MVLTDTPRPPDYSALSPRELLINNIETERLEAIPLNRVLTEEALIDDSHAEELGASMKQKRGQIVPIAVRARINEEGEIVYDVIDGFHRTEGKRRNGDVTINAAVIYGCSDEEMYDLRILAASSVRSVQFPRVAQWITNSWNTTPWIKKGLTVSQAFGIVVNDSQRSHNADLSPEEVQGLKDWARAKCDRWGKTVHATYEILRLVANADPELVRQVRIKGGGKDRTGQITPVRLAAVVNNFPGQENYVAQRAILKVVVEKRLFSEETSQLVKKAQGMIAAGMSEEEIYERINEIPIEQTIFKGGGKKSADKVIASDEEDREADWNDIEPGDDELGEIDESLHGTTNGKVNGGGKALSDPHSGELRISKQMHGRGDMDDVESMRARIYDLEKALEAANKAKGSVDTWWRTKTYLTPDERTAMERIMYNTENIDVVAREMNKTPAYILALVRSAFNKRRVIEPKFTPDPSFRERKPRKSKTP